MKFREIPVVIPCFNEGKTVYQNILKIYQKLFLIQIGKFVRQCFLKSRMSESPTS